MTNTQNLDEAVYTIEVPEFGTQGFTEFSEARTFAEGIATKGGLTLSVVHQSTGALAYTTSPAAIRKQETGEYFPPNTRIENAPFQQPVLEGMVPAYIRRRILTTVYRKVGTSELLIHDGRTGNTVPASNCKQACAITKAMKSTPL